MRTIQIDFTADEPLPDGRVLGRIGEHNAAQLAVTPPQEMTDCTQLTSYAAVFVTGGKLVRSEPFEKTEQLNVPLCAQLTAGYFLSFQLEGYDSEGELIIKSPMISGLRLLPSALGRETQLDDSPGFFAQISLNTASRHSHENHDTLDKFAETAGGALTFNGSAIGALPTQVITLPGWCAVAESNRIIICDYDGSSIPLGVEVAAIELNIASAANPNWVDLRDMIAYDSENSYVINTRTTFSDSVWGNVAAIVRFIDGTNSFWSAINSYVCYGIRFTYYCD